MSAVPGDEELVYEPILDRAGLRVSRSPWGPEDSIGRLNWISDESRAEILGRADGSRIFDLAVDYFLGMPSFTATGDPKYDIWMTHTPQGTFNDDLTGAGPRANARYSYAGSAITMYSHVGTHVCGLNHVGHHGMFWNGRTADRDLGSRAWSAGGVMPPIVGRGVLLDIPALLGTDCLPDSYAITPDDIRGATKSQGVKLRRGDIVTLRTGRMSRWPDAAGFLNAPPGLGIEAARFLCEEAGAMCVGLDVGGEALPPEEPEAFLPVHAYLFATAGTPLIENMWLEGIATEGLWEFAFVGMPMKLAGSTGSPVRPVAIALLP